MATNKASSIWLVVLLSTILLVAFFIPWLSWTGIPITGYDLSAGNFFRVSESKFDLANPFPQYEFVHHLFWLIPVLLILSITLQAAGKNAGWLSAIAALLALCLVTVYILFTQIIIDQVGLVKSLPGAFNVGLYATVIAALGIIVAGKPGKPWLKALLFVVGPLLAWVAFDYLSGQALKSHDETADVKSAYSLNGLEMVREFQENDSLANAKYKEKILTVNGRVTAVELINDSTVNIKMIDTTGAYAIFAFDGGDALEAKKLKEGDSVTVKASCSGGVYSRILGVTYVPFKRSILIKL